MAEVCLLILNGEEFDLNEVDGKAALFHAAKNDLPKVIKRLHWNGLDLDLTDDEGKTAVFYANKENRMDALCELIACGAEFELDEIDGKAALFHAAKNDLPWVIEKLFWKGLALDLTDDEGKTAVFYANEENSMDALCELIACGAKFELDKIDGEAALFHAAENDKSWVIEKLYWKGLALDLTDDEGKTAVFYANEENSMYALCELIACGAKFKLDEIDGEAALFHAAENDKSWVIEKLFWKGLALDLTDDEGKTAVFYANKENSMDALCELIACGAEFELDEIDGKAALFHAAKNNFPRVVKPLYDAGLNLNINDRKGKTVGFYAHKGFLEALMEVDEGFINARDQYGRTPLFYALLDYSTEKARYLIEKGANLQLRDSCNVSTFSFLVENCILKNVEALQSFTFKLFQEEHQRKALALAVLDVVYCQAPLLSVSGSPHLPKSYMILNKANVLKALEFARDQFSIQEANKVKIIDKIVSTITENQTDVPRILSLLNQLSANPTAADSDGNTALHYATLLPLFGVAQGVVMDICKKLRKFGALFDVKNHQRQSPLLFCLSSDTWKVAGKNDKWQSIRGLVEVFGFLLSNSRDSINETSNGESVFHRIIVLFQQGLELSDEASRNTVLQVLIEVLTLLRPGKEAVRNAVNKFDNLLNSPLHLWASITLKSNFVTGDNTFENDLKTILDHLVECGAKLDPRNGNEETPLHVCKTWTAMKLLLDAGANPKVVDSLGGSPLLVAAKQKNSSRTRDYFYPDVDEYPETFWRSALEKGLDPWTPDKNGESALSILVKSEAFVLSKALVDAACNETYSAANDMKLSFLNAICKDESKHTHWKTILVKTILDSAITSQLAVGSPLRFCCTNIVKFGMFDEKPPPIQPKSKGEPNSDDGQPPPKKRRKNGSVEDGEEPEEPSEEQVIYDSVHCKIAKQLLLHGVDDDIRDSCLDIAKDCSPLKDLLTKPIELDTLPILIPWTSVSDRHKGMMAKVARRQECKMAHQFWYHKDPIGSGSFGHIFAGINAKDGREVALKRIVKLEMHRPEDKREIKNLTALADCEQVVRYISFFEDEDFSYVVLELMEGNLEEYLNGSTIHASQATPLCKDVVMGLKFLHEHKILHRDLKPQNILYKVHPKVCLKIADFGLSRIIDSVATTVYNSIAGTRCWIAPEVLKSKTNEVDKDRFDTASDMFSCGMLLHYILSRKKHPFHPTDYAKKSELQVAIETEANLMNGKMEGWDDSLSPEAIDLVRRMLEMDGKKRPSAEKALKQPLFWSNKKKVDFLEAVGNQKEFECPRSKSTPPLTPVETDLEKNFRIIVKHGRWNSSTYKHMPGIYTEMIKGKGRKSYDTESAVELVRFIRNVYEQFKDKTFAFGTVTIGQLLFEDFLFLEYFPDLVMEVYKVVTTHGWDMDKTRDDIKSTMNEK